MIGISLSPTSFRGCRFLLSIMEMKPFADDLHKHLSVLCLPLIPNEFQAPTLLCCSLLGYRNKTFSFPWCCTGALCQTLLLKQHRCVPLLVYLLTCSFSPSLLEINIYWHLVQPGGMTVYIWPYTVEPRPIFSWWSRSTILILAAFIVSVFFMMLQITSSVFHPSLLLLLFSVFFFPPWRQMMFSSDTWRNELVPLLP